MTEAANLVIESDDVQHFVTDDGKLHVYHPEAGTFRFDPPASSCYVAFSRGMLNGGFYEVIASGGTISDAIENVIDGRLSKSDEWISGFAQRVEDWFNSND